MDFIIEMQRDERNGNQWQWRANGITYPEVTQLFKNHPLMTELTMSFDHVELRFRKRR